MIVSGQTARRVTFWLLLAQSLDAGGYIVGDIIAKIPDGLVRGSHQKEPSGCTFVPLIEGYGVRENRSEQAYWPV